MSQIRTNSIVPAGGVPAGASGGGIIQVVSVTKSDTYSATSTSTETLITGLEASITPSSTSSKILITVCLTAMCGASYNGHYAVLKRNGSTNICIGDADGSRNRVTFSLQPPAFLELGADSSGPGGLTVNFLDSPSTTSSTTYGVYHADVGGGQGFYVNRVQTDGNSNARNRTTSSITLMEVSG